MTYKNLPTRWLRPKDFPVSQSFLERLIRENLVRSFVQITPGSRRPVRFVDAISFDRWVQAGKEGAPDPAPPLASGKRRGRPRKQPLAEEAVP